MIPSLPTDTLMASSWFQPAPDSLWTRFRDKPRARFASYFHLIWIVYVFVDLFSRDELPPYWYLVTAVSLPVFLLMYWQVQIRPVRYAPLFAIGIAALGFATLYTNNNGGACYIIYACSFVGVNTSQRMAILRIALLVGLFVVTTMTLHHWPWQAAMMISLIAFSVGLVNQFYRANAQHDAELKLSHDEVRRLAATAERERIGRDLHDLLGHTLSLITLKLELSRRLIDRDTDAARREIEEAERVARHALAEVRSAVTGIRATGIAAELASARLLLSASMVHFEYVSDLPALPERFEAGLALVLREAVTNIHRHARASIAEAKVEVQGTVLTLCIADNGQGGVTEEGNGLCGMRERVRAMGGTLAIESPRGKGTRLRVSVPLLAVERLHAPLTQAELPS